MTTALSGVEKAAPVPVLLLFLSVKAASQFAVTKSISGGKR